MDFFTRRRIIVLAISVFLIGLVTWMLVIRPRQTISALVPEHASYYVEIDKPLEMLKNVQKGIRLYSDPGLTFFAEWQDELVYIQDLLKGSQPIKNYLHKSTIGISAHVLTGKEAGYLFYFPVNAAEQEGVFDLLRKFYSKNPTYSFHERQYLNSKIAEIEIKKDGRTFCLSKNEGTLFGSFSGFLVEEVIRKSGIIFKPNFAEKLKRDHRYSGISGKPLRLFLNLKNLPDYFYQYLKPSLQGLKLMSSLGDGMAFGFGPPNGLEWITEGYLLNENPKEKGHHEIPLHQNFHKYIPGNEAFSFQISMADILHDFPGKKPLETENGQNIGTALEQEFLLSFLEGEGLKKYNRLLVFKIKNQQALDDWLSSHDLETGSEKPYAEMQGRIEIKQHSNPRLGSILGGNLLADWVPLFFARDGDFLVLSDELDVLRRSIEEKNSLNGGNRYPQMPAFIQWRAKVNNSLPFLSDNAAGIFRQNFQEWVPLLKGVQEIILHDNGEVENPGLSLKLTLKVPKLGLSNWKEIASKSVDSTIISPPIRLEWKNQNRQFWVMQDNKFNSYIFDQNLAQLSKVKLFGAWTNRPQLLNIPGIKLPVILLSTPKSLRLFTIDGIEVSPSPIIIPDSMGIIEQSRAIDFDQSRQYRLISATRYGNVYMADLTGKFLEGWNPWKNEMPLSFAPRHLRIGDKDVILMLDRMGKLLLVNRKGEMFPGFPYQLSGRTEQPIFFEPGLDLKTSYIYSLSELGQVEKINLEGMGVSKIQLFRPEKDTRFQFCMDQRQKTFVIARITQHQITIFDQSYRPVFETSVKGGQMSVQHFHFGAGNKVFAILDASVGKVTLYNESGQPIFSEAIDTGHPVDIFQVREKGTLELIKIWGNQINKIEFEKE